MSTGSRSAAVRLRTAIKREQRRLQRGDRPLYHLSWAEGAGGAVDVTVVELPIIHLFVPDATGVLEGGRLLIARTLEADPDTFDVAPAVRGKRPDRSN